MKWPFTFKDFSWMVIFKEWFSIVNILIHTPLGQGDFSSQKASFQCLNTSLFCVHVTFVPLQVSGWESRINMWSGSLMYGFIGVRNGIILLSDSWYVTEYACFIKAVPLRHWLTFSRLNLMNATALLQDLQLDMP